MNTEQAVSSSYLHQNNEQVEACIKFIKWTIKKCIDAKFDMYIALLQIRSSPLEPGLPSPATLLFNCPIRGVMPILNRLLISPINDDDEHHED